jgi:alanine-glyoxylate transaminase/serine-glyoxylate transaminase/serine-pyruvate transaminase
MPRQPGRHFLQIPGPTNVPERVLHAVSRATIDHRGPDFSILAETIVPGLQGVFATAGPIAIYPATGTGAWEAALVNICSPGDAVLMVETGYFATRWRALAASLGLKAILLETDWRRGASAVAVAEALRLDAAQHIRAVCVVHNETSTGAVTQVASVRAAMDAAEHPALLLVDAVSSLATMPYRHDGWGVDVTIAASQKGLMLPPGLSFNAIGPRALEAAASATLPRGYWDWRPMLAANAGFSFPFTPATNLLVGLREALTMLAEEGLENVFARHARQAAAVRQAAQGWGLDLQCAEPRDYSPSVTGLRMPEGHGADALCTLILDRFNISLGSGLGRLKDRVFRIGHLGDLSDVQLAGTLAGVEMGLRLAGVPYRTGGVMAALDVLGG